MERAVLLCDDGEPITEDLLSDRITLSAHARATANGGAPTTLAGMVAEFERARILELLAQCGGNKSEAARRFGLTYRRSPREDAAPRHGVRLPHRASVILVTRFVFKDPTTPARRCSAGDVCRIEETVATPADRQQPRPRSCDRRPTLAVSMSRVARGSWAASPAVEPARRRRRVEPHGVRARGTGSRRMSAGIEEHVAERHAHFLRRRQQSVMIPFGEDRPGPPGHPVDGTRQTGADRHHPAAHRDLILGFDDQVGVIPLQ